MICFVLVVLKIRVATFYFAKLTEIKLTFVFVTKGSKYHKIINPLGRFKDANKSGLIFGPPHSPILHIMITV